MSNTAPSETPRVGAPIPHIDPIFASTPAETLAKKAREFDIDTHLIALSFVEPFYGDVLRSLHKMETRTIPTAGVTVKDGEFRLYWNREFVSPYSNTVVGGILKHEAMHLVLEHTTTRSYEPHKIWNWATDLAINGSLNRSELPGIGLFPGAPIPKPARWEKMTDEEKKDHESLSDLFASLPANLSSEEYFTILMNNPAVKKILENDECEFYGFDDHEGWNEMSEEERSIASGKMRAILKAAQSKADAANAWGSVSADMREKIRSIVSGEISWKDVLKKFVGYQARADRMSSIYRVNKKYAGIHPGTSRDHRPQIAVFLDQSGSMSDDAIALLFGELQVLSKNCDFVFYNFDTEVDESSMTKWRRGHVPTAFRTRCGGTDFDAVTSFVESKKVKCEAYLILTDGMAPKPKSTRIPRGWVLIPGCDLMWKDVDSRDVVVKMKKGL